MTMRQTPSPELQNLVATRPGGSPSTGSWRRSSRNSNSSTANRKRRRAATSCWPASSRAPRT